MPKAERLDSGGVISPDGRSIATAGRGGGVRVLDVATKVTREVVPRAVGGTATPLWSTDNRRLVFRRGFPDAEIVQVDLSTGEQRVVAPKGTYGPLQDWS